MILLIINIYSGHIQVTISTEGYDFEIDEWKV